MSAVVGLGVDLTAFREGMKNAGEAVRRSLNADTLKGLNNGIADAVKKVRASISGAGGGKNDKDASKNPFAGLRGIIAGLGLVALGHQFKQVISEALAEYRKFADSEAIVKSAIASLPEALSKAFNPAAFASFRENLRLALGVGGAELNTVFSDFITRGFDVGQARQLSLLAANYAAKTGKPIADVSRKIADAANGSVDAIKELGVQVANTGNLVADGEAAVLALKAAYGDIGTELVNPSQQLKANLQELYVTLGEKLSPVLEPLIQGVADFVAGLMKTAEGKEILDGIVESIKFGIDWMMQAAISAEGLFRTLKGAVVAFGNFLAGFVATVIQGAIAAVRAIPGASELFGLMGIDLGGAQDFSGRVGDLARQNMQAAIAEATKGLDIYLTGKGSAIEATTTSLVSGGRIAREAAQENVRREMAASKGETFAGSVAYQKEEQKAADAAAKAEEKARQERERALEKQRDAMEKRLEKSATGRASMGDRTAITLVQRANNPYGMRPART